MYLNDLAIAIKNLGLGIDVNGYNLSILLHADDIVLLSRNENDLQVMLDFVNDWCKKWRMVKNRDQTNIVHFRPVRSTKTTKEFMFGEDKLDIVKSYKYLGVYLDDHLTFKETVDVLAASASRAMLRLWNRLVALPESRLTNYIFHWDLTYKNGPASWSDVICKLFSDNELDFYFENVQICELGSVYVISKANECESWNSRQYTKPKLRYYNMYKSDLEQECYLNLNIPKYHRSLFAQFRACILPLAVEVGRYRSLPLSERVCTMCQLQLVEDEYHILCVCGSYDEFGTTLYNKASTTFSEFHNIPELDKFVSLTTYKETSLPFLLKP